MKANRMSARIGYTVEIAHVFFIKHFYNKCRDLVSAIFISL